jgi:bromodomain-containing factor 1
MIHLLCPSTRRVIQNPMDLSTATRKLLANEYPVVETFRGDVLLLFANCYKYNSPGSKIVNAGRALEARCVTPLP